MTATYIGIDPGLTGAIVVLDQEGRLVDARRTPVLTASGKGKSEYDVSQMVAMLAYYRGTAGGGIHLATIEQVSAMPHDGVTSAFRFGAGVGLWRGMLAGLSIPSMQVKPQAWQRDALAGRPRGKMVKTSAVAAAQERWPDLPIVYKRDWGMADAAHIAEFGRRMHRSEK